MATMSNWNTRESGDFVMSFLHHALDECQIQHLLQVIHAWKTATAAATMANALRDRLRDVRVPAASDMNDINIDPCIIPRTQAILVKIMLAVQLHQSEGIILSASTTSTYHGDNDDDDQTNTLSFLAIEILAQLKSGGEAQEAQEREQPIIRISYASSTSEEMALAFLRDVPQSSIQTIHVSGGAGVMELDEWRELFVHQFIQGAGLLDAPSGLRVHEGVIFPNTFGFDCADSFHEYAGAGAENDENDQFVNDHDEDLAICIDTGNDVDIDIDIGFGFDPSSGDCFAGYCASMAWGMNYVE